MSHGAAAKNWLNRFCLLLHTHGAAAWENETLEKLWRFCGYLRLPRTRVLAAEVPDRVERTLNYALASSRGRERHK